MKVDDKKIAAEMLRLARILAAEEAGTDEEGPEDEAFVKKLRDLRSALPRIGRKKQMRLQKFGIAMLRPTNKVEDLVDALMKVTAPTSK